MTSDRVMPWVSRFVLLAALTVLTLISRKFISNPIDAAAASDMTLGSPLAVTNMWASFGAFPLCLVLGHEPFQQLVQRLQRPAEAERDRTLGIIDQNLRDRDRTAWGKCAEALL